MKKRVWLAGAAAVLTLSLLAGNPIPAQAMDKIPEGVSAGGISLAGMSPEDARKTIHEYVEKKLAQEICVLVDGNEIRTNAGELGASWENEDEAMEALDTAIPRGNLIERYKKKKDAEAKPVEISLALSVDPECVSSFVSEMCGQAMTEAVNATIAKKDGEFVITPSQTGLSVDPEKTREKLEEALSQDGTEAVTVEAAVSRTEPEITTEALSEIRDVLGTFSTDFSSSGASRSTNLQVGSSKINGRILMPGEILSGYECMQPFTTENGYRTATAYENGRSVDSIGGGVCQISTTLYNAALFAELEIVQRQNHSMTVSYVKPSMDAAIAGTYKDLKIKNPYDTPIYVEGYTKGKTLTFTIYGKETRPENRTLQFESETLQRIDPGEPVEQPDPSLAPGQRVKVQSGHVGLKSRLFKCVYLDGELVERTLLNSDSYNASKAIYRVGPEALTPELPVGLPSETPPETEPQPTESQPANPYPVGSGYGNGPGAPQTPVSETQELGPGV